MASNTSAAEVSFERDAADLRCLMRLLETHRWWETGTKSTGSLKWLREWLWFYWEAPRHPRPLVRNKYPAGLMWSEAARWAIRQDPKCELIIDHLQPVSLVIRYLLDNPPEDVGRLRNELVDRLTCCVITKAEDKAITSAGFGAALVPGSEHDGWARYRSAAIDPATFAPLVSNP